jgi:hypothetical protein
MTTPPPHPRKVKRDMTLTAADITYRAPSRPHDRTLCDVTKCPICMRKIATIQSVIRRRSAPSRVKHRVSSGATRRVTHRDTRFEVIRGTLYTPRYFGMPWLLAANI